MKCHEYELIIFDLDGTLLDTIPDIADVFNITLEKQGFRTFPKEDYRNLVGWGLRRTLELVLPEGVAGSRFDRMYEMVLEEYSQRPTRLSRIYPGISGLLEKLKLQGVPLIVYTNKSQQIAEDIIRSFFGPGTFRTILGYTGEHPHKPDPSALSAYLAGERTPASHILMVGDTTVDLETAVNASIEFAGASWGFKSAEILEQAGSKNNFSDADALARWLF